MGNVKRMIMDAEEKFFAQAEVLIKESDFLFEAVKKVEKLRADFYNFLDADETEEQVRDFWQDYWSKYQ